MNLGELQNTLIKNCSTLEAPIVLRGNPEHSRGQYGLIGKFIYNTCSHLEDINLIKNLENKSWKILIIPFSANHAHLKVQHKNKNKNKIIFGQIQNDSSFLINEKTKKLQPINAQTTLNWHSTKSLQTFTEAPLKPKTNNTIQLKHHDYKSKIKETIDYLRQGDIYQANITYKGFLKITDNYNSAIGFFNQLHQKNPVPHGSFIYHSKFKMISNSMETFLNFDNSKSQIKTYPIKGTKNKVLFPNPPNFNADLKQNAEHTMIVDLLRNDLGKFCLPGSIKVKQLLKAESFYKLWHGVTEIVGTTKPMNVQHFLEILRATLPGGSISGCPKKRSLEIIHKLEKYNRNYYTGKLFLIDPEFNFRSSILIRSLFKLPESKKDYWELNVGGGIVYDSEPEDELKETLNKLEVFK